MSQHRPAKGPRDEDRDASPDERKQRTVARGILRAARAKHRVGEGRALAARGCAAAGAARAHGLLARRVAASRAGRRTRSAPANLP